MAAWEITNNPTKALVEHLEKHITVPQDADYGKLQAVVSIGTARHDASQHREYERLSQRVKGVYDKWSDPQDVHREMLSDYVEKRMHQYDYFFYYRLNPNVSNHQHLPDLDLDDWRPKGRKKTGLNPGCDTLKTIRDVFHDWFTNDPDANALFSECAEKLVSQRRARVRNAEKWERYAHCTSYECDGDCGERASFALRTEFCRHIHESHGVPLRDAKGIADDRRETWNYKPRRDPSNMKLSIQSRLRAARRRVLGG